MPKLAVDAGHFPTPRCFGALAWVDNDAISEALNGSGEEFGDDRILDCVSTIPPWTDPGILIDTLFTRVREFTVGEAQSDDMTTLVVRYRG